MFTLLCSAPCGTLRWHYRAINVKNPNLHSRNISQHPWEEYPELKSNSGCRVSITALSLQELIQTLLLFRNYFVTTLQFSVIFWLLFNGCLSNNWGRSQAMVCTKVFQLSSGCCGVGIGGAAAPPASNSHKQRSQKDCFLRLLSSAYSFLNSFLKWHLILQFAWFFLTPSPLYRAQAVSNLVMEGTNIVRPDTSPFGLWNSPGRFHQSVTEFYFAAALGAQNRTLLLQTFPWKCSRRKVFI